MKLKELLMETLHSEFKIGFELEALYPGNNMFAEDYFEDIEPILKKYFPQVNKFDLKGDGSIKPFEGYMGFEWASPTFNLTPSFVKQTSIFFSELNKNKIKINESCGLHVHMSFPKMTNQDMAWVTCHLALHPEIIDSLSSIDEFSFESEHANTDSLIQLEQDLKNKNWKSVSKLLNHDKYKFLRMHPQGSLEWRAPRGFLVRQDYLLMKRFFVMVYSFTRWIMKFQNEKTINGISREEFFNHVSNSFTKTTTSTRDVVNKINKMLYSGGYNTEEKITEFLSKLHVNKLKQIILCDKFLFKYIENPSLELLQFSLENGSLISAEQVRKIILNNNTDDITPELKKLIKTKFPFFKELLLMISAT
jgi:hypothetical protein